MQKNIRLLIQIFSWTTSIVIRDFLKTKAIFLFRSAYFSHDPNSKAKKKIKIILHKFTEIPCPEILLIMSYDEKNSYIDHDDKIILVNYHLPGMNNDDLLR